MKFNNKKIIVSTLALAMGAALAGSISGSVAWYQYSTRAAAQLTGTSAGTTGNLYIKGPGDTNYSQKTAKSGDKFVPISCSRDSSGALTYNRQPVARAEKLPVYDTVSSSPETVPYKEYEYVFKFEESVNGAAAAQKAKNVYLSYFAIEKAEGAEKDLSAAVRVEIIGSAGSFLLSKSATAEVTATSGNLDLDPAGAAGAGKNDTMLWDLSDSDTATNAITYINATAEADDPATTTVDESVSASYTTDAHADVLVDMTDPYSLEDSSNDGKILTTTSTSGDSVAVKVRIWLEGWALLKVGSTSNTSASWAAEYIDKNFNVNMQFACAATKL